MLGSVIQRLLDTLALQHGVRDRPHGQGFPSAQVMVSRNLQATNSNGLGTRAFSRLRVFSKLLSWFDVRQLSASMSSILDLRHVGATAPPVWSPLPTCVHCSDRDLQIFVVCCNSPIDMLPRA